MTEPTFASARLKLSRASEQIEQIEREFRAYLARNPYVLVWEGVGNQQQWVNVRAIIDVREDCDPRWSVIVGEVLYDLRSALDHVVWDLSSARTNRNQFPVFDTEEHYNNEIKPKLKGVPPALHALFKSLQPFSTGDGAKAPLWKLHEMCNIDKHRTLHLTGGSLKTIAIQWPKGKVVRYRFAPHGKFRHDTIVAEFELLPGYDPRPENVKVDLNTTVVFDDGPAAGKDVCWALRNLSATVESTINRIAVASSTTTTCVG